MIKRLRIVFAIIATAALLFLNTSPFILYASAWGESNTWTTSPSWTNEPTWKTPPKWETPQWKSPGWNTQPTWKTQPNWQNPGWNTDPSWKTSPDWNSPGWENQPDWNSPGWETPPGWENQPNWNSPGWETQPGWENQPDWKDPNWNDPNGGNSNSNPAPGQNNNINDPTSPDGTKPNNPGDPNSPIPPDANNPQSNDQTNNQNSSDTENNKNNKSKDDLSGPFFEFKEVTDKGAATYFIKDIVGGNINLIDQSLRKGDITLEDFLKSHKKMGISGFKLFTKGDPTIDALYDAYDLAKKPKEVYDKYKTFKEVKKVDDLRKAGDLIEYTRKSKELYETGKSFSTGNAIVSAITMPLTIWDAMGNYKKLNNNASTAEEKSDAKWGLVDNAGSLITGAAPLVAMIPGAQPIAAGMVVVGAAISAVSLGRKLWKNRHEIKDNVVKKAKKVGKWFKSIFKR